jgi:mRNA interferase HigB
MRIIALSTLKAFYEQSEFHDAGTPLAQWYSFDKSVRWASPADVKRDFRSASILKSGRAVFNIAGNKYRLVVKINYGYGVVYIRFIGTHEAYDRIDASEV